LSENENGHDEDDTGFETTSELSQSDDAPPVGGYAPPRRLLRLPLLVFAVVALVAVLLIVYLLRR
jgi:hypothetical protein